MLGGRHTGECFVFHEAPILIGATEECAIRLTDPGVLSNHACIDFTTGGGWLLACISAEAEVEAKGVVVSEVMLTIGGRVGAWMAAAGCVSRQRWTGFRSTCARAA